MADRSFLDRLPQHAAAVFLAVGLLNCDSSNHPSAKDGSAADTTQVADTKPAADATVFKDQGGMFEAPPPPMDAPILPPPRDVGADASGNEAGTLDTGTGDAQPAADAVAFKDQGGMFEAPPPPMAAPPMKRD